MALRLDEGDEAVRDLQQLEHAIATIPQRMQAELRNHRAELERLSALLEAEAEFGTAELEGPTARLREIRGAVDAALEALEQTHETALPEAAAEIDARLDQIDNDLADLDRAIGEVALVRGAAQGALVRLAERLQAAAERWHEMSAAGLTEPTIPQALTYLEGERGRLDRLVRQRTADAYRPAAAAAGTLDEQMGALDAELDALSDLEGRLRQAVEGDVQALADALARCDELVAGRPAIEPDQSRERIAEASERYRQAEAGRQQGTRADLEAGLELAAQARATLESAVADLDPLAETAAAAMQLLAALSPDALAEWADRLSVARTALQKYGRHWDADLSARATAAASSLEQAGNVLAALPADIRQGHVWRQSELPAILAAATTARDALVAAAEDVETLESERERLDGLAEALSTSLERLQSQLLPALRQRQATMLPELQQHMQRIEAGLATQLEVLADPAQVDYDEAVERWLPSLSRQLAEIDEAHAEDIRAYRRLMRDTVADIDRRWARLVRLSPYERPGPEEDVEALAGDLDLWRSDVDAHPDDPLTLRDLLGQRATALQIRIEAAQTQIVEGRRNLGALDRQYTRSADAARATRGRVREAQHASGWSNIAWDTEAADQAWDRALSHERESQAALTLTAAAHEMQQALAAARDAEGIYDRIEGQLRTALRRLSDEQRAVEAHIERLRRSARRRTSKDRPTRPPDRGGAHHRGRPHAGQPRGDHRGRRPALSAGRPSTLGRA
jgi:archaellum component FlaC